MGTKIINSPIFAGGGNNLEVLNFTNFTAYKGSQQVVTLDKDFKYIIVDITKNIKTGFNGDGTYDFIHSIVPSRNTVVSDSKLIEAYGGYAQSLLKVYENCKQGDEIQAGNIDGSCTNVTIIGIN